MQWWRIAVWWGPEGVQGRHVQVGWAWTNQEGAEHIAATHERILQAAGYPVAGYWYGPYQGV